MREKIIYKSVTSTTDFIEQYKKLNVRIKKRVDRQILLFKKNPFDSGLRNHTLHEEWEGCRSIDITNDYRAIYEEKIEGEETVIYFIAVGTHYELYRR